jgi:hypothetical protein
VLVAGARVAGMARSKSTTCFAAAAAAALLAAAAIGQPGSSGAASAPAKPAKPAGAARAKQDFPPRERIRDASRFAAGRGTVSFAVMTPKGGVRGLNEGRRFSSASASKALLLAAFLRGHRRLSGSDRAQLDAMIRFSDNRAADSIYAQVGDGGLRSVARRAGMRDFDVTPGFWGGAQITAADMARFFFRLERNLGERHRDYGMRLLATIISSQRWGIPRAAGGEWQVWFKGGWRPGGGENTSGAVTHQAALLRHRSGRQLGLAILTGQEPGGPSFATLEGITRRLLNPPPPDLADRWPVP